MRTFLVKGMPVEVPDTVAPGSPEEQAIAADFLERKQQPGNWAPFLKDQARTGFHQGISNVAGLAAGIAATPYQGDPSSLGLEAMTPPDSLTPTMDAMKAGAQVGSDLASRVVDPPIGIKPTGLGQQIAGAGVKLASDPTMYAIPIPGGAAVKAGGLVGKIMGTAVNSAMKVGGAGGIGMESEVGSIAGEHAAPSLGLSPTAGRVIGGLVGGVSGAAAGTAVRAGTQGVSNAKSVAAEQATAGLSEAANKLANRHVNDLLQAAMGSDAQFAAKLEAAMAESKATGVPLPLSVLNNPVLTDKLNKLARSSPTMRAELTAMHDQATQALQVSTSKRFGSAADAREALPQAVPTGLEAAKAADLTAAGKAQDSLVNVAAAVRRNTDSQQFGAASRALIDTQERLARDAAKPAYNEALAAGGSVSADATASLKDQLAMIKDDHLMSSMPTEVVKLEKILASNPDGFTLDVLDQVKRAVNAAHRDASGPQRTILGKLKDSVGEAIDSVPGAFPTKYRAADDQYRALLGPFHEATIAKMDRAQFDEWAAKAVLTNKSTLQHYIYAGGEGAQKMAEDALLTNLGKAAMREDGTLNPAAVTAWMKQHEATTNVIPGLTAQISDAKQATIAIHAARTAEADRFATNLKENFLSAAGKDSGNVTAKIIGDEQALRGFLKAYPGQEESAQRAARSLVADAVSKDPAALAKMLERKGTMTTLFGEQGMKDLEVYASASDKLRSGAPARVFNADSLPVDVLEKATGISIARLTSVARARIMSPIQKIVTLGSVTGIHKSEQQVQKRLQEALLTDVNTLHAHVEAIKAATTSEGIDATKYVMQMGKDAVSSAKLGQLVKIVVASEARGAQGGITTAANKPATDKPEPYKRIYGGKE